MFHTVAFMFLFTWQFPVWLLSFFSGFEDEKLSTIILLLNSIQNIS